MTTPRSPRASITTFDAHTTLARDAEVLAARCRFFEAELSRLPDADPADVRDMTVAVKAFADEAFPLPQRYRSRRSVAGLGGAA